ncbi:hypothetical protein Lepto7375DRAFT_0003 [Leptolyngbya sp. PCC 7375]|nr:hypothetical protein Lepto7375DRAFT_0003 [Leptolyngbya sp. PCC 7375]
MFLVVGSPVTLTPVNRNIPSSFLAQNSRHTTADDAMEEGNTQLKNNPRQAVQEFERAIQLYRELALNQNEAIARLRLGVALERLGEKQEALEALEQSLIIVQSSNNSHDLHTKAEVKSIQAHIYHSLGEYERALILFQEVLSLNQQLNNKASEGKTLISLGSVYQSINELKLAQDYYRKAATRLVDQFSIDLAQSSSMLDRASIELLGDAMFSFALVTKNYNHDDWNIPSGIERDALARYNLILGSSRGSPEDEARILNKIGASYNLLAEYSTAFPFFDRALDLAEDVNNSSLLASIFFNLAQYYQNTGQYFKALDYYQQTLPLLSDVGDKSQIAQTHFNIAQLKQQNKDFVEAKTHIEETIRIIEDFRSTLDDIQLRTTYFANVQEYYQFYIEILMQMHQKDASADYDVQAFDASERSRARMLLELGFFCTTPRKGIVQNETGESHSTALRLWFRPSIDTHWPSRGCNPSLVS